MNLSGVVDVSAADPAGGFSFGSGYLIAPGLVLTARHVACADSGEPYDDIRIRFLTDPTAIPCEVIWQSRLDLDAVLLRCPPGGQSGNPVRWGELIASTSSVRCEAAGFPRSMRQDDGLRDLEHIPGVINPGTGLLGGRLYFEVAGARPEPGGWDGVSGSAIWCGSLLVGMITRDTAGFSSSRLMAIPATHLLAEPEFRALLGGSVIVEAAELQRPLAGPRLTGPAYLLRAEAGTARFRSRATELEELAAWCAAGGVRVQLLTGPGGQGKTRLAQKLAHDVGWVSVWLPEGALLPDGIRSPLLVIIDYAETRPTQVAQVVLAALAEPGNIPIRILLLARSAGDWWTRLRTQSAELEMALTCVAIRQLPVLESTPEGRSEAFGDAITDYDAALTDLGWPHLAPGEVPRPTFADHRLGSALQLQMAALAGLLGKTHADERPEDAILRHETRYWMRAASQHGISLHEDTLRTAVTAVTLCGSATESEGTGLLTRVPGLRDQTEDVLLRTSRWLRDLYPPFSASAGGHLQSSGQPRYWGALQPDLLAEDLVARVASQQPRFLVGLLASTTDDQDRQALTLLTRASATRAQLAAAMAELLRALPKLAGPAVEVATQAEDPRPLVAALDEMVTRDSLTTGLLASIAAAIPERSQILATFAVTVHQMIVADYTAQGSADSYPSALGPATAALARRLAAAGQLREALVADERAVLMLEQIAETEPRILPTLAMAVNNRGSHLIAVGNAAAAIAAFQRALSIREKLPSIDYPEEVRHLAGSLTNLAAALSAVGRWQEALTQVERALSIFAKLTEAGAAADKRLADLGLTLANQAKLLSDAGSTESAVAAARHAVDTFERLTDARPDAWGPMLALALNNLSGCLALLGSNDEALTVAERAAELCRQLRGSLPDACQPALAHAERTLSIRHAEMGNLELGLAASRRAVAIDEQLAAAHPEAFQADLAESLNHLACGLLATGQHAEALDVSRRSVALYDRLIRDETVGSLPDMARSLLTLATLQSHEGNAAVALATCKRAVAILEQLAHGGLAAHRAGWAVALNNLALLLTVTNHDEDGLATARKALEISQELAAEFPDAYGREVAGAWVTLAFHLDLAGHSDEAVIAQERAVDLLQTAATERSVQLAKLAAALSTLSELCAKTGRSDDALAASYRSVRVFNQLAADDPQQHRPALAEALSGLAARLATTGWPERAAAASRDAIAIYDTLVARDPQKILPELARVLDDFASQLADARQPEQELEILQRAIAVYEQLAQGSDAYVPALARLQHNLGARQFEAQRFRDSVQASRRAVDLYEQLARSDERHRPDLASALRNLSGQLAAANENDEALAVAQRSYDAFVLLNEADPGTHLPGLARSLNNLSLQLANAGRYHEAVAVSEQAVQINQQLEATEPREHLHDLAKSSWSLALSLKATGRPGQAFLAARKSSDAFGQLVAAGQLTHMPALIASLETMSKLTSTPGERAEWLAALSNAIDICQRLARLDPSAGRVAGQAVADLSAQLRSVDELAGGAPALWTPPSPARLAADHVPPVLLIDSDGDMRSRAAVFQYPAGGTLQPVVMLETRDRVLTIERGDVADAGLASLVKKGLTRLSAGELPGFAPGWKFRLKAQTAQLIDPQGEAFYEGAFDAPFAWRALVRKTSSCLVLTGELGLFDPNADFSIAALHERVSRSADAGRIVGGFVSVESPERGALGARESGQNRERESARDSGLPGAMPTAAGDAMTALELGDWLAQARDFEGARAAYQHAIRAGHALASPAAAANLGILLAEHGDREGARAAFQQAIDSGEVEAAPVALVNLGMLTEAEGNPEVAREIYQAAAEIGGPDVYPLAWLRLGILLAGQEETAQARAAFEQAIDSGHREWAPTAAYNLGELLERSGDWQAAIAPFQQAFQSGQPGVSPFAAVRLGVLLARGDDTQAAKDCYQAAISSGQPAGREGGADARQPPRQRGQRGRSALRLPTGCRPRRSWEQSASGGAPRRPAREPG